jgi:hypothetical protein
VSEDHLVAALGDGYASVPEQSLIASGQGREEIDRALSDALEVALPARVRSDAGEVR